MIHLLRYPVFFILLLSANPPQAQDLTGTWEGNMSQEFLQVNIVQVNDELCGYTWDYVFDQPRDYCQAYFKGKYNKEKDCWVITGTSFIENSGTHMLMRLTLWNDEKERKDVLEAEVKLKSIVDQILSLGHTEKLQLKRVSRKPTLLPHKMPPCFTEQTVIRDSAVTRPPDTVPVKKDTVKKVVYPPPVTIGNDTTRIVEDMRARKKNTISLLPVNVKHITLNVYDNAITDGDTVTIFYNGRLLVNRQLLSEKPIVLNIDLDERVTRHELTLFANNLGSIPPNTALIVVTAGDKRYEIHSSASLEENAVLVFEYTPK